MKRIFLFALWILLMATGTAWGATIAASSCSPADIMIAIDAASDDDTVTVPNTGTCTLATKTVEQITNSGGKCNIKITGHGWQTGAYVYADGGLNCNVSYPMTLNKITVIDADHFTIANSSYSGNFPGGYVTPALSSRGKGIKIQGAAPTTLTVASLAYSGGNGFPTPINFTTVPSGKKLEFTGFAVTGTTSDLNYGGQFMSISTGSVGSFRVDANSFTSTNVSNRTRAGAIVTPSYGVIDNNTFYGRHMGFSVSASTTGQGQRWAEATDFGTNKFTFIENNRFTNTDTAKAWAIADNEFGGRVVVRYNAGNNKTVVVHGAGTNLAGYPGRAGRATEVYNNIFDCSPATSCASYYPLESFGGAGLFYNNVSVGVWSLFLNLDVQRVSDSDFRASSPYYACDGTHSGWDGAGTAPQAGYPCRDQAGAGLDAAAYGQHTGVDNTAVAQTINDPLYFWHNTGSVTALAVQTSSIPYLTNGVEYFACADSSCAKGGYTRYTCPHPLVDPGAGGTCDAGTAGLTGYHLPAGNMQLTVTYPDKYGLITSVDGYINCGKGNILCSYNYAGSTAVTLTYTPSTCWKLADGAGGDCTWSSQSCSLTMSAGKSVSATPTQTCGAKQALY